ncbi:MAG: hypothetical protein DRJ03_11665 [Chloroflexi bacterium]|nr:MAG: hypothetical protein DRJ03_11665 [Chloroflexota bacterium]
MNAITNEEYLEAIDGAIDKWIGIVEEKYDPASGKTRCSLCELCDPTDASATDACLLCPLTEIGQRCGYPASIWARYVNRLRRQAWRSEPLDLTPRLKTLALEMIKNLREARKKYEMMEVSDV